MNHEKNCREAECGCTSGCPCNEEIRGVVTGYGRFRDNLGRDSRPIFTEHHHQEHDSHRKIAHCQCCCARQYFG